LYDNGGGVLSPVEALPRDDHVSVVVFPPGQPAFLCKALDVGKHRGFVLGGSWYGADLLEESPERLILDVRRETPRGGGRGQLRQGILKYHLALVNLKAIFRDPLQVDIGGNSCCID